MRNGRRAAALAAAALTVMTAAACGSSDDDADAQSAAQSSAAAAGSTAAPGTYGSPVDPSLPNPTGVATDAPATPAASDMVDVVVTYSGWDDALAGVDVGAYVSGIAETGGTCTLTLTAGGNSATASAPGEPEASSTSCPGLVVPGSELSSGNWTAVVSYESPTAQGESDSVAVVVP
jgi:hypothetical protein